MIEEMGMEWEGRNTCQLLVHHSLPLWLHTVHLAARRGDTKVQLSLHLGQGEVSAPVPRQPEA